MSVKEKNILKKNNYLIYVAKNNDVSISVNYPECTGLPAELINYEIKYDKDFAHITQTNDGEKSTITVKSYMPRLILYSILKSICRYVKYDFSLVDYYNVNGKREKSLFDLCEPPEDIETEKCLFNLIKNGFTKKSKDSAIKFGLTNDYTALSNTATLIENSSYLA